MITKNQAVEKSLNWWYCDNIISQERREQVGLLRMDFPQVFILIRDYGECYFATFEEFKEHIAEVNFFNPEDRKNSDVEDILIDAWNFLALQEEEEERLSEEREEDY